MHDNATAVSPCHLRERWKMNMAVHTTRSMTPRLFSHAHQQEFSPRQSLRHCRDGLNITQARGLRAIRLVEPAAMHILRTRTKWPDHLADETRTCSRTKPSTRRQQRRIHDKSVRCSQVISVACRSLRALRVQQTCPDLWFPQTAHFNRLAAHPGLNDWCILSLKTVDE